MNESSAAILDPAELPPVDLQIMQHTHEDELAIVNELADLLQQTTQDDSTRAAITSKLETWVEHTRAHFAQENELMQRYGFPPYPVHSGEHANALEKIEAILQQWLAGGSPEAVAEFLNGPWKTWFLGHVTTMDRVTAQFLRQVGA